MASKVKMRVKVSGDMVAVKALVKHPMETGLRKNKKTGNKIPAHYIQTVTAKVGDKVVMSAFWGGAVSKNPYVSFSFKGKAGDKVDIECVDNQGKTYTGSATAKQENL